MLKEIVFWVCLFSIVNAGVIYQEFTLTACRRSYEETVGDLIVSQGYPAATAVWRLLFNSIDVNNNDVIGASEVIVKLETEKIATTNDMKELLAEAQDWIGQAQGGDKEINFEEFVQLISRTLGHVGEVRSPSWTEVAADVCSYFNSTIPDIVTSFKRLISCSNSLKEKQLELMGESNSQELVLNTWQSVHASLGNINQSDLSLHLCEKYEICDVIETDLTGNETMGEFYDVVRSILFDESTERAWLNMTSLPQLRRRMNTCMVLDYVRNKTMTSFQLNKECVSKYDDVTKRLLGNDVGVAPSFIFTTIDGDRDGIVTSQELDSFLGQQIETRQLFQTPMSLSNVTSLLPDHVTEIELSRLPLLEQREWKRFCLTSVQTVADHFPLTAVSTDVNVTEAIDVILKEFQNPESKHRDEILNLVDRIRDLTSTAPIMTSSTQQSTAVASSTTFETTTLSLNDDVTSTALSMTSLPNSDNFVEVVRDVITELKNDTHSNSSSIGEDLSDLLDDEVESSSDVIKGSQLSEEELELFKVLSEYERDVEEKKETREMSDEEELEELLVREIKKERN